MQGCQHIASLRHLPEHSPVLGFPGLGEGWWAREVVLQGDSLGDNEHCWWSVVSGCLLSALLFQPGIRVCTRSSLGTHQALKSEGALESSNLCLTTRAGLKMVISELTKGLGIGNCLKQEREIC